MAEFVTVIAGFIGKIMTNNYYRRICWQQNENSYRRIWEYEKVMAEFIGK